MFVRFARILAGLALVVTVAAGQAVAAPAADPTPVPDSDLRSIGPVRRGQSAADVRRLLGRPASKTRPELWGADGAWHSEWKFPARGVTLGMVAAKKAGRPSVEMITVAAPCDWKTTRGIRLGSTVAEVDTAYPPATRDPNVVDEEAIIVGSVFDGLAIRFAEGKVIGISVGSFAE
jgi:hypothetical protein